MPPRKWDVVKQGAAPVWRGALTWLRLSRSVLRASAPPTARSALIGLSSMTLQCETRLAARFRL